MPGFDFASENSMGPVSFYRLAMIDEGQLGFSSETTVVWRQARDLGYPYYITAQWNADDLPSTFIVGREDEVGGFFNGPLLEKGHWHPALGVGSTLDNVTKITYSSTGHEQHAHISIAGIHVSIFAKLHTCNAITPVSLMDFFRWRCEGNCYHRWRWSANSLVDCRRNYFHHFAYIPYCITSPQVQR